MLRPSVTDTRYRVETPEGVWLSFRLAGPGTRLGAFLLDLLFRALIVWGLATILGLMFPFEGLSALPQGILLLGIFLVEWGYTTLFEGLWGGRTPGKSVLHLRVIKEKGYPINFFDALLRNLLRTADVLPITYSVGWLAMLSNRRMQRLGDLVAGTIVVVEERRTLARVLGELPDVPEIPKSAMENPRRPSERTLILLEKFTRRRRQMVPARENEIAAVLAPALQRRLGYEEDPDRPPESPGRFLQRVLRTFAETVEPQEQDRGKEPDARKLAS